DKGWRQRWRQRTREQTSLTSAGCSRFDWDVPAKPKTSKPQPGWKFGEELALRLDGGWVDCLKQKLESSAAKTRSAWEELVQHAQAAKPRAGGDWAELAMTEPICAVTRTLTPLTNQIMTRTRNHSSTSCRPRSPIRNPALMPMTPSWRGVLRTKN